MIRFYTFDMFEGISTFCTVLLRSIKCYFAGKKNVNRQTCIVEKCTVRAGKKVQSVTVIIVVANSAFLIKKKKC